MSQFYTPFFNDFERELNNLLREHNNIISLAKSAISFIEEKIVQLNNWLRNHKFQCMEEEIYFFKCLKPKLISKLIYYKAIFTIESEAPVGKKQTRKHYEKALNKTYHYSKKNKEFYSYYRSGSTHKDESYFIRSTHKPELEDECFALHYDTNLCTEKYYDVSKIIANDMLIEYCENKIEAIERKCTLHHPSLNSNLNWTGSKFDLIELIYALHHQKVINDGNVDLKEVAQQICKTLNVEYDDQIYRYYHDIKRRKTNKTRFLQSLSDNLNQKLSQEN